jgi:hypothetical protein
VYRQSFVFSPDEADVRGAGERLEEYAKKHKRERAARLRRVK